MVWNLDPGYYLLRCHVKCKRDVSKVAKREKWKTKSGKRKVLLLLTADRSKFSVVMLSYSCKLLCSRPSTTMNIFPRTVGESLLAETFGVFPSLFRRDRLQQIFFREKEKDFHRRLDQGLGHTFLNIAQGRSMKLTHKGGFL